MKIYILLALLIARMLCASDISGGVVLGEDYINEPFKGKVSYKKGDYMIASLRDEVMLDWAKRFKIVELGDIDNPFATKKLFEKVGIDKIPHRLGYSWMPAFYYYTAGKNRDFIEWLYKNRNRYTLNPKGPFLHCKSNGYDWCEDYYFNYGEKTVSEERVDDLIENMNKRGFNGIFFDWGAGKFYDSDRYGFIRKRFKKLYPGKQYVKTVAKFYSILKKKAVFFVTNQAFRREELLKYPTYDMTESYITTDKKKDIKIQIKGIGWKNSIKVTDYYPIYKNSDTIKDSLKFIDLLTKYKKRYKKYGFKNFIYLNYIAPEYRKIYPFSPLYKMVKPKNAIYFSYAMAKLTGNLVYAMIPQNRSLEKDEVYFYNLGKIIGQNYKKLKNLPVYVRFYENGFVLASERYKGIRYIRIKSRYLKNCKYLLDTYRYKKIPVKKGSVVIKLQYERDSFSKKYLPLGRVYLFLTEAAHNK